MKNILRLTYLRTAAILALALLIPAAAGAFDTSVYASRSALADGRWVKISVAATGMHFIPASDLRAWGFTDPMRVSVHGYGGNRLDDRLALDTYIDDLPRLQTVNTQRGVWFYGVGPVQWQTEVTRRIAHKNNPYSLVGYYFLTESTDPQREIPATAAAAAPEAAPSSFTCSLLHETDQMSFGESGNALYGESFIGNPSRSFTFDLVGRVPGTRVQTRTAMATDGLGVTDVTLTANGAALQPAGTVYRKSDLTDKHTWLVNANFDRDFDLDGTRLTLGIKVDRPATVRQANLDYIEVNYTRSMNLDGGKLDFTTSTADVQTLAGVSSATRIWDVTDPLNIRAVNATVQNTSAGWRAPTSATRTYTAWDETAKLPAPVYVGAVANQNLHGSTEEPDMVIFSLPRWGAEAERMANIHRYGPDSLRVMVVNQQDAFNEFASGSPDYGAFRRMLKMLYDRGNEPGKRPLRYALFFGAASFDNRLLTAEMKATKVDFMPSWQTDVSNVDGPSLMSDDVAAMLLDNSSPANLASTLQIAVGRIPCRSTAQAKNYVDKVISYLSSSQPGLWRNTVVTVADNGNGGDHMNQNERMLARMDATDIGSRKTVNKVYLDSYDIINGTCVGARNRMYRQLNDGALLWTYIGHGALESLTAENMVRTSDIDNEMYFRNLPMLYAATCNFMQWDGHEQSGAERMLFNPKGGVIAAISATRTALISHNGDLSEEFGRYIFNKDESGRMLTVGEALRRAKNALTWQMSNNRMRYALAGSPAMRLVAPENQVVLETIGGAAVGGSDDEDIVIKARQHVRLTGIVADPSGRKIEDFNGSLWISLYDAASSVTSQGIRVDGIDGAQVTYDDQSSLLYQGRDTVANGEFDITIAMPSEIADNYRPALISFFARSSAKAVEASGVNREFYVYGTDNDAEPDTVAPVIEYAYLNHHSFTPGSIVNEQPLLLASVTDDVGINLSMAGIGHQMTLQLDGKTFYTDVSLYYTPFADGRPGGTIAYPLPTLSEGNHELTLRVYDTSGNSAHQTLSFYVQQGAKPVIFDIYSDANPATTHANFYLQHNRPDAVITVTFEVYDMMGRRVWSSTSTDRSDMFLSAPIQWNLCALNGARVSRGIYIYRATVKSADGEITSQAKRIAVSGR